uniref:RNA helicase n=1 Tax=Corvus moneduloides TaxID=1196302 RepID=A0A8C3ETF3_CORMO
MSPVPTVPSTGAPACHASSAELQCPDSHHHSHVPHCPQVPVTPLPAFPTTAEEDDGADAELDTQAMVRAQNQKKKKSGGFQSMGLSYPVFKGIMKKGYKVPTPIQRKTIPAILRGRDVVAMARTGSGKTACFLIPMFERLKAPSQAGARALILSPTRELALQTLKFTKELGKFTGLKTALILGGDKMEDQFAALHENPDIIIATPGRLVHVAVEMKLKLHTMEYVVFDEADRLFEMGFAEQLQEIITRLPDCHQTVLFSATLPKLLVEFARAGLTEPMLIRLDVESKLSEQLKLAFFHVRGDDKPAVLLHLLRSVVKPQDQTVVFVATKHHTEYLKELLTAQGIRCTHIYSSLDQTARKINIAKFSQGKCPVLLVTDVAARGLDIPMLDNVINFSFPARAKLFLHRVDAGGVLGRVPQSLVDDEECLLLTDHEASLELRSLRRVADNAHKQYLRSRPGPSPESIKRAKDLDVSQLGMHPLFSARFEDTELERLKFVDSIKTYKSKATIFEINATSRTPASTVMRSKRRHDHALIEKFQRGQQEKRAAALKGQGLCLAPCKTQDGEGEQEDLQNVFLQHGGQKRKRGRGGEDGPSKKPQQLAQQDEDFYIPYRPKDFESERGLSVGGEGSAFEQQAAGAVLDLMGDENHNLNKSKQLLKWDRKKKRFVGQTGQEDKKKVRTESGRYISSSYKSNLYEKWKQKYKVDERDEDEEGPRSREQFRGKHRRGHGEYLQQATEPCIVPLSLALSPALSTATSPRRAHAAPGAGQGALGAEEQAADPEAAQEGGQAALPAERGPEAPQGQEPAARAGAAANGLRAPGGRCQEGQAEEEDVGDMPPMPGLGVGEGDSKYWLVLHPDFSLSLLQASCLGYFFSSGHPETQEQASTAAPQLDVF